MFELGSDRVLGEAIFIRVGRKAGAGEKRLAELGLGIGERRDLSNHLGGGKRRPRHVAKCQDAVRLGPVGGWRGEGADLQRQATGRALDQNRSWQREGLSGLKSESGPHQERQAFSGGPVLTAERSSDEPQRSVGLDQAAGCRIQRHDRSRHVEDHDAVRHGVERVFEGGGLGRKGRRRRPELIS